MSNAVYYLSSFDSTRLSLTRECRFERLLVFESGKTAAVARLSPGVIGQDFNCAADIEMVVLTPRHEGVSIDPVSEFPCFVFVAIPSDLSALESPIRPDDLEIIGWGELYRTRVDAESHNFG